MFPDCSWLTRGLNRFLGTNYSPSISAALAPDSASPYYPDRPIRPLPKRRLRSRLSSGVADSILYPSLSTPSTPLFNYPYNHFTERNGEKQYTNSTGVDRQLCGRDLPCGYDHEADDAHEDLDSEDEEDGAGIVRRYQGQQNGLPSNNTHSYPSSVQQMRMSSAMPSKPPPPRSNASSADGYDSFENTNNKKKRKIPTSGSSSIHHSHLSAGMANMGISTGRDSLSVSPDELGNCTGQYYGSGNSAISSNGSGNGISGAGRGRYGRITGRSISGKSPLGVSTDGSNAWAAGGRGSRARRDWILNGVHASKEPLKGEGTTKPLDQGIISAAIASAAEKGAVPPPKGQENVSLLQQPGSKRSTPTKTQFTFTCETDSSKGVVWPLQSPTSPVQPRSTTGSRSSIPPVTSSSQGHRRVATQGTQTSPSMGQERSSEGSAASQNRTSITQHLATTSAIGNQQVPPSGRKPRPRRTGNEYALAARQRRLQQEYNNYHHPPSRDEVWICEFCEYEAIFGAPPVALMRQYEIKDRRERRRLAEKRRLLEKAKSRGKKGKKGGKAGTKHAGISGHGQQQQQQTQPYDQQSANHVPMQNTGAQSDEYYADDYEDDDLTASSPQGFEEGSPLQAQQPPIPTKPFVQTNGNVKGIGAIENQAMSRKAKSDLR
ncbi:MAG: hypothetical protein M1835_000808 [Candelina submexicana]|nr:MAG: hypothetical protein M1835_000808 [Candelina submexicana]